MKLSNSTIALDLENLAKASLEYKRLSERWEEVQLDGWYIRDDTLRNVHEHYRLEAIIALKKLEVARKKVEENAVNLWLTHLDCEEEKKISKKERKR